MKEKSDPPEELKSFHSRSMLIVTPFWLCSAVGASWGLIIQDQEDGNLTTPTILFFAGWVLFVGVLLYQALFAVPKCPDCARRMKPRGTVQVDESPWRIVECRECGNRYRVPGLAVG